MSVPDILISSVAIVVWFQPGGTKAAHCCGLVPVLQRLCACVQAVRVCVPLLEMLGSGRALYDLCASVLLEPDLTPSELVDYTERQSRADLTPFFLHEWGDLSRPSLNPLQLLGVTFAHSNEEVSCCCVLRSAHYSAEL